MLSLYLVWALGAWAATPVTESELAEQLRIYHSISQLKVAFKQTKHLKDMGIELHSEGRLQVTRPDKIVWEITRPSPVRISIDAKEIRIDTGRAPDLQTQVIPLGEGGGNASARSLEGLTCWLNLDLAAIFRRYEVFSIGPKTFLFKPKGAAQVPFQDIKLVLGQAGRFKSMVIHELSGDQLDLEFDQPQMVRKTP